MSETIYLRVRREVKDRLERLAKERGAYLVDVASEALDRGLGLQASTATTRVPGQSLAERLIGTWKLKNCRHLAEDGYCSAWEFGKEEAERIYGGEAKELMELRELDKPVYFGPIQTGVEKVEVYGLKPSPSLCLHCPFFERK